MKRKLLNILVILSMLFSVSPTLTYAESVSPDDNAAVSEYMFKTEISETESQTWDEQENRDELLSQYLDNELKERFGEKNALPRMKKSMRLNLSENSNRLYETLKSCVTSVADGESTSTAFTFSVTDIMGYDVTAEADTQEVAYEMAVNLLDWDVDAVRKSLLANCPYDLFWYDKKEGIGWGFSYSYSEAAENGPVTVTLSTVEFQFAVCEEYAGSEAYTVDEQKIGSIQTALDTISEVISENSALSDYKKLCAYKDRICSLTSYNYEAAGNESTPYGNPWQLIWVFDKDPATTVVCEGYAKAFKYLCDLSGFTGDVDCYSVNGTMNAGNGAGAHMWNLVHMEDGLNYLVDVTNCDEGMIGAPDDLFLAGASSGSVDEGYSVVCSDEEVVYVYGSDTSSLYTREELTLSMEDYEEPQEIIQDDPLDLSGWQQNDTGWWYQNEDGSYPKDCWKKIDGKWYHFNARGYRQTGWLKLNDLWYYFQEDGVMVTGWKKIGSDYYYFNNGGSMAHDTWVGDYYLTSGGKMAKDTWIGDKYVDSSGKYDPTKVKEGWVQNSTGWWYRNADGTYPKNCWKKIDGNWYHFSAKGYRQTGWLKLNDTWYYFKNDGIMATGWMKIGSYWYYFYSGGAMAHDTWKGDYYLLSSGRMATNTWIGNYYVDKNGKWVKDAVKG